VGRFTFGWNIRGIQWVGRLFTNILVFNAGVEFQPVWSLPGEAFWGGAMVLLFGFWQIIAPPAKFRGCPTCPLWSAIFGFRPFLGVFSSSLGNFLNSLLCSQTFRPCNWVILGFTALPTPGEISAFLGVCQGRPFGEGLWYCCSEFGK